MNLNNAHHYKSFQSKIPPYFNDHAVRVKSYTNITTTATHKHMLQVLSINDLTS